MLLERALARPALLRPLSPLAAAPLYCPRGQAAPRPLLHAHGVRVDRFLGGGPLKYRVHRCRERLRRR